MGLLNCIKVHIFQGCCWLCKAFDLSIDTTTFEIKDILYLLWVLILKSVLHEDDMDCAHFARPNCKDTIEFRQQTIWISFVVFCKAS
jgi:hypothetical protein